MTFDDWVHKHLVTAVSESLRSSTRWTHSETHVTWPTPNLQHQEYLAISSAAVFCCRKRATKQNQQKKDMVRIVLGWCENHQTSSGFFEQKSLNNSHILRGSGCSEAVEAADGLGHMSAGIGTGCRWNQTQLSRAVTNPYQPTTNI